MRARSVTVAGVLSLATAVNAVGSAIINNNCDHDVYLWPVSVDRHPSSPTIIKANGGKWSEQYQTASTGGISLKLSSDDDLSNGITQFEYTLDPNTIWYDISNVDCLPFGAGLCPFQKTGMFLQSGSGCPKAKCAAGADTCHDAYTYPKDDWASLSCKPSDDTILDLCSASGGSSDNGVIGQVTSLVGNLLGGGHKAAVTSSSSEEAPPPAPTTSSTPTTTAAPTTSATPTPATSSSQAQWSQPEHNAGGAYNDHGAVGIAAVPETSAAPATPSTPSPSTSKAPKKSPPPPPPSTTLATVAVTTEAPAQPNVAVVFETVTEMVATTTVVYQHRMAHKAKRDSTHPHARRHHHDA